MSEEKDRSAAVVILGAGPAGLTAGYELGKAGYRVAVLEKDDLVGGIARTVSHNGFHFDIGGHRFFTRVEMINRLWEEMLEPENWVTCDRLSRIYYGKRFFYYPLRLGNVLAGLGVWNSACILVSYLYAQVFPLRNEISYEDWVINRFGRRLYQTFFKSYTEKVWGISCREIRSDWAAQRIRGLSLLSAVKNALLPKPAKNDDGRIKTLVHAFQYPKLGPGMLWRRVAEKVVAAGGDVETGRRVVALHHDGGRIRRIDVDVAGTREVWHSDEFISTLPLRELVCMLEPAAPAHVLAAANALRYRDFLTVAVIIRRDHVFPDHWIYIHDPSVKVGRIQNFKNWSPYMVPDKSRTCLGLEYFCFENDGLWSMQDNELVELASTELVQIGLAKRDEMEGGVVVRMPKAYPIYDGDYRTALDTVRQYLSGFQNLQMVGRNGMHRYNNQDHSMVTAVMAARNIAGARHDVWDVNLEEDYHEEVTPEARERLRMYADLAATQPPVPEKVTDQKVEESAV